MLYFAAACFALALVSLGIQLWYQLSWRSRAGLWHDLRHHDHLIPPAQRSPRAAR